MTTPGFVMSGEGAAVVHPPNHFEDSLTGANRDAYVALTSLFASFGLSTLAPKIFDYIQQGYGADTISLLLQDTSEFKTRFAGNEQRKAKGLSVLTPQQYLATEAAYRQVMSSAGLPKGFYDSPGDYASWIGGDVAPTEIKERVDEITASTTNANPAFKEALQRMYGIGQGEITAYYLDQAHAAPLLRKMQAAAQIGAAAIQRGFSPSQYAEAFATEGITADQANAGYGYIADTFETIQGIANRYGEQWTQGEAERDVFEPGKTNGIGNEQSYTGESVTDKKKRLASQERALFSGSSSIGAGSLNAGQNQT